MNIPDELPRCPICHAQLTDQRSRALMSDVTCEICGPYQVARFGLEEWDGLSPRERGLLSGVLRARWESHPEGERLRVSPEDVERFARDHGAAMDTDASITRFLSVVAREAPSFGQITPLADRRLWAARAYLWSRDVGVRLITEMQRIGFVRVKAEAGDSQGLLLTVEGWAEHERRRGRSPQGRQGFIASWGDHAILGAPVGAISSALTRAGLEPVVGSRLAERDRVTDSIEASIRRARVVIAEYTGARGGVYFEAGLARGLGIPVIHCCHRTWATFVPEVILADAVTDALAPRVQRATWESLLHFDTKQFPHIMWSDTVELEQRVLDRVQAWGLDMPISTAGD